MMKLGALLVPVVDPEENRFIANQARQLEVEGFQSLWSAQAIGCGFMMTDPFICLSTAAAVTENVTLGPAVIQVPLYHPIDLAHRIFSLQQVCGKRLVVGLRPGSTAQDFDAFD
ncbi:MAG: LLM class flavin-dependent oxidoreductase [Pseudomonadales bacterium]|nr:LLM class flavin-dependent oxidoreductase [Pseudomonadales bacterium]